MTGRVCGECGLCCKVVAFPELEKPRGVWCRHYAKGAGCTIHETRPDACRKFFCSWLSHIEFDDEWRPDRAGFFMWEHPVPNGRRLVVEVDADRPDAWMREPYLSTLRKIAFRLQTRPVEVIVRISGRVHMLFPEGVVDLGEHRNLSIESGYRMVGGRRLPFAHYLEDGVAEAHAPKN